jgi:tRNA(Ile)-lysidine synthase
VPPESLITDHWQSFDWNDRAVVVAVSGGADSVALLRVFTALENDRPRQVIVAHFNHQLRDDAEQDAQFVAGLAEQFGLPFALGTADVRDEARRKGDGLEAAARDTRYRFFEEVADHHRAHFVATAHTADDQAETILHRILRGTGVGGLRGMREWRLLNGRQDIALVRPLLPVRRAALVQYLAEIGQPFREDPSNRSMRFTRNRIRHRLLPHLEEEYNPAIVEAILRLGETADGVQGIVHELVLDVAEEAVTGLDPDSETATLDCRVLQGLNHHLIRELFVWLWREMGWPQQQMGLEEWDALALDAGAETEANGNATGKSGQQSPNTSRMYPGKVLARRSGDEFTLIRST